MCAHTASHTAIMISHPFSDEWMRKRKSAVALYCPPSKVERRERTQSDCGKKSDKSHRNKRNLSLTTLALSPLSAVYTEQTPVAGQETTAHTNKNCKPHTRSHTHTHTHTHTQEIVLPFPVLCECELAGLQAGVQRLALFQDWSTQANSATPSQSLFQALSLILHFSSLFLLIPFLCYALSCLDLLHLRSQWVGQWHLRRFIISVSNITNKGKGGPWAHGA